MEGTPFLFGRLSRAGATSSENLSIASEKGSRAFRELFLFKIGESGRFVMVFAYIPQ
jgi:hypothetical protein